MSYPVGLPTKEVSFGQAIVMESGVPLGMRVTITASRSLVYRPTGQPLVAQSTVFAADQPSGTRTLTLPICDSPDMGTGNGQAISITGDQVTHTYTARIEYLNPTTGAPLGGSTGSRLVGPFVIRSTDPETVDLDDMIIGDPADATPGIPVYVPAGGGISEVTYDSLPAGALLAVIYTGVWAVRPTDRTDIPVFWLGGTTETPPPGALPTDPWFRPVVVA